MATREVPMTIEAFYALPPCFAMKHEYSKGIACLSPRQITVVALAPLAAVPAPAALPRAFCDEPLAALTDADDPVLLRAFREGFASTPDFGDYRRPDLERFVRGWIQNNVRPALPGSVAVRARRTPRSLAALLALLPTRTHSLLDTLLVRPRYARRGLATQMFRRAAQTLREAGATHVFTTYHPLNTPSVLWHAKQGFVELPSLQIAHGKLAEARMRAWQAAEGIGDGVAPQPGAVADWEREVERLQALAETDGYEAAEPIYWVRGR